MNSLIQTRKLLGLSQEAMAGLLGSSRSRLSHAEAGRRSLEPHAIQQFAALLQKLQKFLPAETSNTVNELLSRAIQTKLEELQFRLRVLQRQQQKMLVRQQQHACLSHCLNTLDMPPPGGKHVAKQLRKTELIKAAKAAQFELDNKEAFFLELEIAALEFQLAYCGEFLGRNGSI